jgi:hypothetical protein
MEAPMLQEPQRWTDRYLGKTLIAGDGEAVGSIESLFYNRVSEIPEWFVVSTGFLGRQRFVVPIAGSEFENDSVRVPYPSELIRDEPDTEAEDELTAEGESILGAYFGLGVHEEHSSGQLT